MIISVPKETNLNETRVAATPQSVKELIKAGYKVKIQTGAGNKSFISDAAYKEAGANIIEIDAVGAIAVLFENLSLYPYSAASGHAPLSSAKSFDA